MSKAAKTINVDTKTFVRFWLVILAFVAAALFINKAWNGLFIVCTAAFLSIAIRPLALRINRLFMRRKKDGNMALSSILAFLVVACAVVLIVAVIGPAVVGQTAKVIENAPTMFEKTLGGWDGVNGIGERFGVSDLRGKILGGISAFAAGVTENLGDMVMTGVGTVTGFLGSAGLALVLTIFFLLEGPKLYDKFWKSMGRHKNNKVVNETRRVVTRMTGVISTYVFKQISIGLLDGMVTTILVLILSLIFGFSMDLALPMGMIGMVFYLIPMFGQIISCAVVAILLLFNSPIAAVIYVVCYIVYVQVENNIIAPRIQGGALNLSPLVILVSIVIGMNVAGLIGAIIAIPVAGCIRVIIEEYPGLKALKEKEEN